MSKFNVRDIFGVGLVLLGLLMLLENLGILAGATGYFWGAIWIAVSLFFFNAFQRDHDRGWWNIIPAMALLGLGVSAILPSSLEWLEGSAFLASLGLAFFIIYYANRSRWWGIIPGGVMLTLATVSALEDKFKMDGGAVFFLGLGITFLLVAVLPGDRKRNDWAYIPSVVLLAIGGLMLNQLKLGALEVYLPYLLIGFGVLVLGRFLLVKRE